MLKVARHVLSATFGYRPCVFLLELAAAIVYFLQINVLSLACIGDDQQPCKRKTDDFGCETRVFLQSVWF